MLNLRYLSSCENSYIVCASKAGRQAGWLSNTNQDYSDVLQSSCLNLLIKLTGEIARKEIRTVREEEDTPPHRLQGTAVNQVGDQWSKTNKTHKHTNTKGNNWKNR